MCVDDRDPERPCAGSARALLTGEDIVGVWQGKRMDSAGRRVKGRGEANASQSDERYAGRSGQFESVDSGGGPGPSKSVEGWIIFVSGLNEETNEEGEWMRGKCGCRAGPCVYACMRVYV